MTKSSISNDEHFLDLIGIFFKFSDLSMYNFLLYFRYFFNGLSIRTKTASKPPSKIHYNKKKLACSKHVMVEVVEKK